MEIDFASDVMCKQGFYLTVLSLMHCTVPGSMVSGFTSESVEHGCCILCAAVQTAREHEINSLLLLRRMSISPDKKPGMASHILHIVAIEQKTKSLVSYGFLLNCIVAFT